MNRGGKKMPKQLYWEDVAVGSEVAPIPKVATTQMLVKWAGASGDFNPAHYEDTFAKAQGLERAFVHGQLKRAWLVQLMTNWIGDQGTLKKLSCQFRAVDWPRLMKSLTEPQEGDTWWCKGTVTNKYVEGDEHYVECDIWVENAKGEKTTPGKAVAVLPSRGG
jgi:hypothetical protein